jgi:hypothetical protein
MTDLSPTVWREIELNASIHDGTKQISLPILRNILRRSRRTPDQNALLWALYDDALKAGGEALGGWTKDDIHEYMLGFADFVEFVVRRFAEHGIVLKLPGEQAA